MEAKQRGRFRVPVERVELRAPTVISLPINPEVLNEQLKAIARTLRGELIIVPFRLTFHVSADSSTKIPLVISENWKCTRSRPLSFWSTYYHEDLAVNVYCDGSLINRKPLSLTSAFSLDFGIHYIKEYSVDIEMINDTDTDAKITFQVSPNLITRELYETWYEPLLYLSRNVLAEAAKLSRY